jgi:hypothetical protein
MTRALLSFLSALVVVACYFFLAGLPATLVA